MTCHIFTQKILDSKKLFSQNVSPVRPRVLSHVPTTTVDQTSINKNIRWTVQKHCREEEKEKQQ